MLEWLRFALSAALMTAGLFTLLVAVIGVYKFDYVLNRMHAAATADTLGILFCLLSLMVSAPDAWTVAKLALIVVFLWVASPVNSHLIARLEVTVNPRWQQLPPRDTDAKGGMA